MAQQLRNRFKHPIETVEHIVVPEPGDCIPMALNEASARCILMRTFPVMATIEFYDEPRFAAHAITDIWSDRHLSAEFETLQLPPS